MQAARRAKACKLLCHCQGQCARLAHVQPPLGWVREKVGERELESSCQSAKSKFFLASHLESLSLLQITIMENWFFLLPWRIWYKGTLLLTDISFSCVKERESF